MLLIILYFESNIYCFMYNLHTIICTNLMHIFPELAICTDYQTQISTSLYINCHYRFIAPVKFFVTLLHPHHPGGAPDSHFPAQLSFA